MGEEENNDDEDDSKQKFLPQTADACEWRWKRRETEKPEEDKFTLHGKARRGEVGWGKARRCGAEARRGNKQKSEPRAGKPARTHGTRYRQSLTKLINFTATQLTLYSWPSSQIDKIDLI